MDIEKLVCHAVAIGLMALFVFGLAMPSVNAHEAHKKELVAEIAQQSPSRTIIVYDGLPKYSGKKETYTGKFVIEYCGPDGEFNVYYTNAAGKLRKFHTRGLDAFYGSYELYVNGNVVDTYISAFCANHARRGYGGDDGGGGGTGGFGWKAGPHLGTGGWSNSPGLGFGGF